MSVRVRVRNFQSLEDAEIVIDGFVVVSGPNNSGKSALMRAIRALFTNAAPGPLLRHGAAYLSVEITFDDGNTVLWEKGSERPEGKGKSVNRYTLNGKALSSVGRGVPPEVSALGFSEISAGSAKIWPQAAEQFSPLFLLDRSGAVVAEALSDVEKVGRLTEALRLSEKDKRSNSTELNIRRQDLSEAKERLERFEGLGDAETFLLKAEDLSDKSAETLSELRDAKAAYERWSKAQKAVKAFQGFDWESPDSVRLEKIQKVLQKVRGLRSSWVAAESASEKYDGFSWASPDPSEASLQGDGLKEARSLYAQMKRLQESVEALAGASLEVPPPPDVQKLGEVLTLVKGFSSRAQILQDELRGCESEALEVGNSLQDAEAEVNRLLGDRGFCPTCKTVHVGEVHS